MLARACFFSDVKGLGLFLLVYLKSNHFSWALIKRTGVEQRALFIFMKNDFNNSTASIKGIQHDSWMWAQNNIKIYFCTFNFLFPLFWWVARECRLSQSTRHKMRRVNFFRYDIWLKLHLNNAALLYAKVVFGSVLMARAHRRRPHVLKNLWALQT